MKNMNERKAEVYRRGRERVRAEKRLRRSLVAVCLPVAAIVICLPLLQRKEPENHWMPTETEQHMGTYPTEGTDGVDTDEEAGDQLASEVAPGVEAIPDASAMIQSVGTGEAEESYDSMLWVTEPEQVAQLRRQIDALLRDADPSASSESSDLAEAQYRLTFRDENGTLESYILAEMLLKNETTGACYRLNTEEAAALEQLIHSLMD